MRNRAKTAKSALFTLSISAACAAVAAGFLGVFGYITFDIAMIAIITSGVLATAFAIVFGIVSSNEFSHRFH